MADVDIVIYTDTYHKELEAMLVDFSQEVYGYGTANLDQFVQQHWVVYLAMKGDEVIGFSSFNINHYFGLRPPTVGNSYLYVKPAYRKGKATYLLTKQAGFVSIDINLPLETYYASDASKKIGDRLLGTEGSFMYETHFYDVDKVKEGYKHFKI